MFRLPSIDVFEPRMLESIFDGDSFFRVFLEEFTNKVLGLSTDSCPVGGTQAVDTVFNFVENFIFIVAEEWRKSAQQDIHDDSETPNITGMVIVFL